MRNPIRAGAVVLAGGRASRMRGQDKPLQALGNGTLLSHVINNIRPLTADIVISANHAISDYRAYGIPVVPDRHGGYPGPLAGIHASMRWFAEHQPITHLIVVPGDAPCFPSDAISALLTVSGNNPELGISWLQTGQQLQPLFSVWSINLDQALETALDDGIHSPKQFIQSQSNDLIYWDISDPDDFGNINTEEQLAALRQRRTGQL